MIDRTTVIGRTAASATMTRLGSAALIAALGVALWARPADACGCFAPPDPSVPIVQAGERILFAVDNGIVTAHIQIQYAGDAKDFGWLLPLPSVPTMKLGTEELFTQLINSTQPRYFVQTTVNGTCAGSRFAFGPQASAGGTDSTSADAGASSPLVSEGSIGPYNYAVLKADSKDEMFNWLTNNHYFIPAGTDSTVGPYIHAGGYFLALKLKSGKSAGDIQPVVLTYPSDLPMIPIILTSVAAQPNMGVQVWMLGASRAIPRNYNHVVINDSKLDWLNQAKNYNEVVLKAISETPEKHAFITEYAGPSSVMVGTLDYAGRFGSTTTLATLTNPADFVEYLFANGFAPSANNFSPFPSTLAPLTKNLVLAQLPLPTALAAHGYTEDVWLRDLRYFLNTYRQSNPQDFIGWTSTFDAGALAAQLDEKVVQPAKEAGALFSKYPKLSRLFTALSPQDMTRDPVFSFNPSLADVSRDHNANLVIECNMFTEVQNAARTLTTEQGWVFHLNNSSATPDLSVGPGALRIETLPEEGAPNVLTDNANFIAKQVATAAGCTCSAVDPLALGLVGLLLTLRRRRAS